MKWIVIPASVGKMLPWPTNSVARPGEALVEQFAAMAALIRKRITQDEAVLTTGYKAFAGMSILSKKGEGYEGANAIANRNRLVG